MRDIADTLAFLAIKTLTGGGFDLGPDRKDMRGALTGAFEDLLNRLPEGTVAPRPPLGYIAVDTRSEVVLTKGYWGTLAEAARGWASTPTFVELREVQP